MILVGTVSEIVRDAVCMQLGSHAPLALPDLLKAQGLRVALFVDCEVEVMPMARAVGADRVELYTEPYARAFGTPDEEAALRRCLAAAEAARAAGLGVNAGHDLNLDNLPRLAAAVPWLLEVSIGHAIAADALLMGFPAAVRAYLAALSGGPGRGDALPFPGAAGADAVGPRIGPTAA